MRKKKLSLTSLILFICLLVYLFTSKSFLSTLNEAKANINSVNKNSNVKEEMVSSENNNLEIYITDVGQADSILVRENNVNMLIDAGNNNDGKKLVNYYKSLGINDFKYVFASHAHEDHIGGMDDIINNFNIENFYMPNKISTSKTFVDMLDALENNNLKYTLVNINDRFNLDNCIIEVIWIGDDNYDFNNTSIVLKLTYLNNSFLFTGDLESSIEKEILNKGTNIKSDVLKVGHHGSSFSTTSSFLDKVSPSIAVISVGKNNVYNHPSSSTLDKLNKRGIKVYRTDLDGTILIKSNGKDISVETIKTDTNG